MILQHTAWHVHQRYGTIDAAVNMAVNCAQKQPQTDGQMTTDRVAVSEAAENGTSGIWYRRVIGAYWPQQAHLLAKVTHVDAPALN